MARDHARLQTARARDDDWCALPVAAQWLYDTILTQPGLSYCGVLLYVPGRLAKLATDATVRRIEAAVRLMERTRFVVVDRDTQELLIRTYVRHDRILDRANMGKAMGRALELVASQQIRHAVMAELSRCYIDNPAAPGWVGFGELYPMEMETVLAMSSTIPLPMALGKG